MSTRASLAADFEREKENRWARLGQPCVLANRGLSGTAPHPLVRVILSGVSNRAPRQRLMNARWRRTHLVGRGGRSRVKIAALYKLIELVLLQSAEAVIKLALEGW